jgi:hypothetical protein
LGETRALIHLPRNLSIRQKDRVLAAKSHGFSRERSAISSMIRTVSSTDIARFRYPAYDVLPQEEDRINRMMDLQSAMTATNIEHEQVGIIVQLNDGEEVEIISGLVDVEDDVIEVKGAHLIPIRAILRVEV